MISNRAPKTKNGVIITGASDGIGRAMAVSFAKRGMKLGLLARREQHLQDVAAACRLAGSPRVEIAVADVTDSAAYRRALEKLDLALGSVDTFIANAGIATDTPAKTDSGEMALKVIAVNVSAAIDGIEFFKPRFRERGGGTLVGVSSIAGARGFPQSGVYCASKAALTVYLESIRIDLRRYGIQVTEIAPGFIDTPMTQGNEFKMPLLMNCDEAGAVFVQGIINGRNRVTAPRVYILAGWILRATPGFIYDAIGKIFSPTKRPQARI